MNNGPLGWENCGETIRTFAEGLIALLRRQLGEDLKGVYLHGSLAMGCFYFPKSDLDLIGVSSRRLCQEEAESLNRAIADRAAGMPEEGGLWGLAHLPEPFRKLIRKALEEYRGKGSAAAGVRRAGRDPAGWDFSALTAFADFAARELERADGEKGEERK